MVRLFAAFCKYLIQSVSVFRKAHALLGHLGRSQDQNLNRLHFRENLNRLRRLGRACAWTSCLFNEIEAKVIPRKSHDLVTLCVFSHAVCEDSEESLKAQEQFNAIWSVHSIQLVSYIVIAILAKMWL